jgi:murein DD-endopeptidase MepM/ murein hydrolase activator NlpD
LSDTPNIPPSRGVKIQHPQPGASFFSPFGMRIIREWVHKHPGIDCGKGEGSGIFAIADGIVVDSGLSGTSNPQLPFPPKKEERKPGVIYKSGAGYYVLIDHGRDEKGNTYHSFYCHLKGAGASKGKKVKMGEAIGQEGNTGLSTAPHLHFEIRVNGKQVDPMPYIKGAKLFPAVVL